MGFVSSRGVRKLQLACQRAMNNCCRRQPTILDDVFFSHQSVSGWPSYVELNDNSILFACTNVCTDDQIYDVF
jgi:hypothetical protein